MSLQVEILFFVIFFLATDCKKRLVDKNGVQLLLAVKFCPDSKSSQEGRNPSHSLREQLHLIDNCESSIFSIGLNGAGFHDGRPPVEIPFARGTAIWAMDYDFPQGKIFYTDIANGVEKIKRIDFDGKNPVVIANETRAQGIAVDWIAGNVYWVNYNLRSVEVATKDGAHRKTLYETNSKGLHDIVVHPEKGLLFWILGFHDGKIERADMNGDEETRGAIVEGLKSPTALTVDYDADRLFWATSDDAFPYDEAVVESCDLRGRRRMTLAPRKDDQTRPFAWGITSFKKFVYWTDYNDQSISRIHIPKYSADEHLQSPNHVWTIPYMEGVLTYLTGVEAVARERQNGTHPCKPGCNICQNICLARGSDCYECPQEKDANGLILKGCGCNTTTATTTSATTIETVTMDPVVPLGVTLFVTHHDCDIGDCYNVIYKLQLFRHENSHRFKTTAKTIPNSSSMKGSLWSIDYGFHEETLFYTDTMAERIRKINMEGGEPDSLFYYVEEASRPEHPHGLAYDWIRKILFWTDTVNGRIIVSSDMDNRECKTFVVATAADSLLFDIAVHPIKGLIFWTLRGGIGRSFQDGSDYTKIAFVRKPTALTINYEKNYLFWIASLDGIVESAKLDGSDRRTVAQIKGWSHGLTTLGDFIYWTERDDDCVDSRLKKSINGECEENSVFRSNINDGVRQRVWNISRGLNVGIEALRPQNGTPRYCNCEGICLAGPRGDVCSECLGKNPPDYCELPTPQPQFEALPDWTEYRRIPTDGILYMIIFAVVMLLLTLLLASLISCVPRDSQPEKLRSPAPNQCVTIQSVAQPN